jgi:hypothetical protein
MGLMGAACGGEGWECSGLFSENWRILYVPLASGASIIFQGGIYGSGAWRRQEIPALGWFEAARSDRFERAVGKPPVLGPAMIRFSVARHSGFLVRRNHALDFLGEMTIWLFLAFQRPFDVRSWHFLSLTGGDFSHKGTRTRRGKAERFLCSRRPLRKALGALPSLRRSFRPPLL